jgi:Bacterial Ig-like domain
LPGRNTHSRTSIRLAGYGLVLACFVSVFFTVGASAAPKATNATGGAPASPPPYTRLARAIETGDLGIPNPSGLAFSPGAEVFLVVQARAAAKPPADSARVFMVTRTEEELAGSVSVAGAVTDPLNLVVDRRANRVLTFDAGAQEFVAVKLASSGVPDPASVGRFNARALALQEPRGLTMDPASGRLYLLDTGGQRIVRVDPAPDLSLDMTEALNDGRVSTIDLRPVGVVGARGLAFNPADGHIYVLSPAKQALYELTPTGQVVAARDLADSDDFALIDPGGMVFAPSGDSTDDPANQSLYIADSRVGDTWRRPGQIMELSLVEAQASAVASTIVPTLVHTTFTSQWSSPSPDPMGGAYIPTSGTLMISDSEIEEYQRPYWNGGNVFSSTRQGQFLPPVQDITNFTNEPTGIAFNPTNNHLFISDDNMKEVFEVNPGNDGRWFTGDDSRTQFDTKVLGTNDTEDVAYDPFNGYLYLSDGLNSEVWEIRPGPNGRFDGVSPAGDDQASHWDTSSKSISDPEGITVNSDTGTLYVTGHGSTKVIETTTGGTLLNVYDIAFIKALYGRMQPSGLAYGPSSVNPAVKNLYITDRAVDNDADPRENDGKVHEITLGGGAGDTAPAVLATTPAAGATDVQSGANIAVNFTEAVTTSGTWFNISCATSGAHTATVSGGPQSFTLNPDPDFALGESCTVGILASLVTDQDTNDPPDNMAADFLWSFTTTQPSGPPTTGAIYLSLANSGAYTVGSVTGVHDEDVIYFDGANWSMFFDGSDVSVTGEVDAFHIVDSNTILFSLAAAAPVGSLGTVESADIVQFDGTLGATTAGTFSLFLDGSSVGLDTSAENIDGIDLLPDGRVLVSTVGSAGVVTGARDEDLLAFTPTSAAWAMYFDGSDVDLATTSDEDVDGVDVAGNGDIHLTTRGLFSVTGVSGDDEDVFVCTPTSLGDVTSCNYSPTLYFDGSTLGLASNDVDAINLP